MQQVALKVAAPVYINPNFNLKGEKIPMRNNLIANPSGLLGNIKYKQNIKHIKKWMVENASEFDIVHAHFSMVGWEYMDVCKQLNKKLMVSFYGFDYEYLPHVEPIWQIRYQHMFAKADVFICEGPHGKETLLKKGCPAEKIYIIPLGVDVPSTKPEKHKLVNELNLIQIANFKEKKGQIDTLVAFAAALDTCPNMHLTMVGDGAKINECREFAEFDNIQEEVTFIPHLPFEKLPELLYNNQVLIQPSKHTSDYDCEGGAPVVLLDAMANGLPIISTKHCDIPHLVKDGETGLLSSENDVLNLQKHIEQFYNMDSEYYNTFSQNCYSHTKQNFDHIICSQKLEHLYIELCK